MQAPIHAAQAPPASTSAAYTIFVDGTVAGREDVTVQTTGSGTTITGSGRLSGSLDILMRRAEVRYRPDWTADVFELEALVNGGDTFLQTTFREGVATTKGIDGGEKVAQSDRVPEGAVVLSHVFFGSYEALSRRLATAAVGDEIPAFVRAGVQIALRLTSANAERMQVGTSIFDVRRYVLSPSDGRTAVVNLFADDKGSLLRVSIPAQHVDVMRDDLASSTARTAVHSNPGDEAVTIPGAGFNLGATLTRPPQAHAGKGGAQRLPAVILLAGPASDDRDGILSGVPMLGQLAGAIAEGGSLAVRYDKRGYGQSGGRAESATIGDHADDARAVVKWLTNRPDVDRDRIVLVGHSAGAWVAWLAATRERRIAGVVAIASPSTTGAELVLEQQRHILERLNAPPANRVAKIELQARINAAVMSGRGWEDIPADMRKQADTPWFQSFLAFDPAKVIEDLRQPLLFVHGELDAEVPIEHLDRLAALARDKSRSRSVAVVAVKGVNHLLVPAITGDLSEYASLPDRNLSADVKKTLNDWLANTFAAIH